MIHDVVTRSVNNALKGSPLNLGRLTLYGIRRIMRNPLIKTNTALGYLLLSIPLSYAIGLTLKEDGGDLRNITAAIRSRYPTIVAELKKEKINHLYTAIKVASEGHLGKFIGAVPSVDDDVTSAKVSVWDAMASSACYDIVAYDLTHGFSTTLLALNKLLSLAERPDELLEAIPRLQARMLSEMPDTLVLKVWGLPTALLLSNIATKLEPGEDDWRTIGQALRNMGVNPGSTSDIMCAAIALYLVRSLANSGSS